jgi:RNA polymerase sigma-70 factor (ECF subfamily)
MDPRWAGGDPQYFRGVMEQHAGAVISLARSFSLDRDELEDLVQEIWIQVFRQRKKFLGTGSLLAWILAVARNVCLGWQRKEKRRSDAMARSATLEGTESSSGKDRLDVLDAKQRAASAMRALADLPSRQREAITLRLLEGMSPGEAAERMGCEKVTVRSLIHTGLHGLRETLEASP